MTGKLDMIEAILRRTGCNLDLAFTPHREGYKFELTRGVILTQVEYQTLRDRLAASPPLVDLIAVDSAVERRNRNRAHRRASESDHA